MQSIDNPNAGQCLCRSICYHGNGPDGTRMEGISVSLWADRDTQYLLLSSPLSSTHLAGRSRRGDGELALGLAVGVGTGSGNGKVSVSSSASTADRLISHYLPLPTL